MEKESKWWVYLIETKDGFLYTGITNSLDRRYQDHQNGKGAKFFRMHPPKELVYKERCRSKSHALIRENEIKKMTRREKNSLVLGNHL